MESELNDAIIRLIKKDGFYANLLFLMNKSYSEKTSTLGVNFKNNKVNLIINTQFFLSLTVLQQEEALVHECDHIIRGHVFEYRNKGYNHKRYNVACDIQINERLTSLHEIGMTADKFGFPKNLVSDEYYKLLEDKGDGGNSFDDHDWSEGSEEAVEAEVKDMIEKAINNTPNKGSVPGSAIDTLEKLKKKAEVPWNKELGRFIGRYSSYERAETRMKKNRRFGWQYAGNKVLDNKLKIGLCIDTSGSVSDEMIKHFFAEIDRIHSEGHQIVVFEIDTEVQKKYDYVPKSKIVIHGRGGTIYQPALDGCKKEETDIIVFFGDGGCFDKPSDVGVPTIWVLGKGQTINCGFGKKVNINV
jgi:predicted metal-dependent peptidase